MNKTTFTIIAITILLLASFIPVAENVTAEEAKEAKTIEVPVKIYTLQGVKEIRKELPINEAMKLQKMANKAKEAMEILHSKNASFMERIRANEIIDSLLYELKKNGLLGNLTIKEAKELITGKYLQKQKNSMEARKIMFILKLLNQNGWQVNAMCYFTAFGAITDIFPWNLIPSLLAFIDYSSELISIIIALLILFPILLLDCIPHPTTVGYWIVRPAGMPYKHAIVDTIGLFGKKTTGEFKEGKVIAFTIGFTGVVIFLVSMGFTLLTTFKKT